MHPLTVYLQLDLVQEALGLHSNLFLCRLHVTQ